MKSFSDLARQRYSLRRFSDRAVDERQLTHVLEVGRLAPTGMNAQPQRILVLRQPQELRRLATCTPYVFGAPAALVVCYDPLVSWQSADGHNVGEIDATLVACHMVLAAQECGLGTLIVGDFDEGALRATFHIPEPFAVTLIICLGYPHERAHPTYRLHDVRLPLEKTVSYGAFPPGPDLSGTTTDGVCEKDEACDGALDRDG